MATWNSTYELNPQNFRNPGEGAFHFRDLKVAVRERGERDHFWGDDEDAAKNWYGGKHKEGSAKASVADGGTAFRGGQVTALQDIGQMQIEMDTLVDRTQDGTPLQDVAGYTYQDKLEKIIKVVGAEFDGTTGTWVAPSDPTSNEAFTIFDYDTLVDIIQDQVIKGIKEYVTSPQVPNIAAGGSPSVREGWETFLATATPKEKLSSTNVDETNTVMLDARTHNIFDSTDADNPTIPDVDSPTGDVVTETIEATSIYGTTVKGAVWNA